MQAKDENVDLYYSQTDADENGHYTIKLKNGDVVLYTHRIQSGHGLSIRKSDKKLKWSGNTSQFESDPIPSDKRKTHNATEALDIKEPRVETVFCQLKR